VCAPDMTREIAMRFGVEPCVLATPGRQVALGRAVKTLVDIGLSGARRGVDVAMYIVYVRSVRPTWAVVPDRFGDFRATLAQWLRYSHMVARFAAPIFVAQEFHRAEALDAVLDMTRQRAVEHVALPMRQHPDVSCSKEPRLCAERAERILRILCGAVLHIHLLGPSLRAVRMLRSALVQCERQGTVVSFDTAAYRRASDSQVKKQLGGRWMPRNSVEASMMLVAWLRQALL